MSYDLKECPACGLLMTTIGLYPDGWNWVCTSVECRSGPNEARLPVRERVNDA